MLNRDKLFSTSHQTISMKMFRQREWWQDQKELTCIARMVIIQSGRKILSSKTKMDAKHRLLWHLYRGATTCRRKHTNFKHKLYRTEYDHQSHLYNRKKCKKSWLSGSLLTGDTWKYCVGSGEHWSCRQSRVTHCAWEISVSEHFS